MRAALVLSALLLAATEETPTASQAGKGKGSAATEWNQFRGPNRDGHSPDTGLLKQWPSGGPPKLWEAKGCGRGYSSLAVVGGKVYTLGDDNTNEYVHCFDEATGKPLWKARVGPAWNKGDPEWQSSRSTPTLDGALLFALGAHGDLVCLQAATGREAWRQKLDGKDMADWGFAESPLVDGNLVVVTPGGSKGSVQAFGKANGQAAWRTTELKDDHAYTSLIAVEIAKIRQYVVLTDSSVAGIAANGKLVWRVDRSGRTAVCPTPAYSNGMVLIASGYGSGHNAYRITSQGGRFKAEEVYSGKELDVHHGGIVVVGEHVYAVNYTNLVCLELKTGKTAWSERCVGKGSIMYADGHLVVRGERGGGVALVEASPTGFKEKGRINLPDPGNRPSWSYPVVARQKLFLRGTDTITCYNLKGE
jgi:outer membrane protein assembly factor BamB